jgi:hypothetical protein
VIKIIQLMNYRDRLLALDSDGAIWAYCVATDTWTLWSRGPVK